MKIRRAVASDAEPLAALAARTYYETFVDHTSPEDMAEFLSTAYGIRQQRAEIEDPNVVTFLAVDDDQVIAFAQVRPGNCDSCDAGPSPVELWRFYVDSGWHGRGVAQTLMRAVEQAARDFGGETLWLGVWERNERAKAFYAKCGFIDIGSHHFVVGKDVQTDRVMARAVPAG